MAEPITRKGGAGVTAYLNAIPDRQKHADCRAIANMWGSSIVAYGSYDYKYASGHQGNWPICGFSLRARNITIYVMPGFAKFGALMKKLGKYKTAKSCLYIKKLEDIDQKILKELIAGSVDEMRHKYG